MKHSKFLSSLAIIFIVVGIASVFVGPSVFADTQITQDQSGSGLPNPIGITDPRELAGRIIKAMLGIVGSIALLVFIYGGFMWVSSGGNEDKVQKGKNAIMWASLGIAIIFLSYAVVTFVIASLTGSVATSGA